MSHRMAQIEARLSALESGGGGGKVGAAIAAAPSGEVGYFPPKPHDASTKENDAFNVRVPHRILEGGRVEALSLS